MSRHQPKPGVENPCPICLGWGWYMVCFDPDVSDDCAACSSTGRRPDDRPVHT